MRATVLTTPGRMMAILIAPICVCALAGTNIT